MPSFGKKSSKSNEEVKRNEPMLSQVLSDVSSSKQRHQIISALHDHEKESLNQIDEAIGKIENII